MTSLGKRQSSALAILLIEAPRSVSADRLIDEIWGEATPQDPEAALHNVISRLRSVIGDDLQSTKGGYSLVTGNSDIREFERAADEALRSQTLNDYETAIGLWEGDAYSGLHDIPTVRLETERLRLLHNRVQLELVDKMTRSGREHEAADHAAVLVQGDPFNEHLLELYMRALFQSGRKREALAAFRSYEKRLADESGLEPSGFLREVEFGILIDELDRPVRPSRAPAELDLAIQFVERAPGEPVAIGRGGTGNPLMIHPGWMSRLDWVASGIDMRSPIWSKLSEANELIVFDRFGTGLSEGSPEDFSFRSSVDELKSVLRQTVSGPVPVWAASGAGPIVIQTAYESPDLISHLILYATYASGPTTFPPEVGESMAALIRASWTMGSEMIANLLFPAGSAENREIWTNAAKDLATPEVAVELLQEMYAADVSDILSEIRQPSLVIHYRGDKAVPLAGGMHLARSIPGAELVTLEGVTHYPLPGDEERVADLVRRFLEDRGN